MGVTETWIQAIPRTKPPGAGNGMLVKGLGLAGPAGWVRSSGPGGNSDTAPWDVMRHLNVMALEISGLQEYLEALRWVFTPGMDWEGTSSRERAQGRP